jgi:biopolymer transport protein ExbD
MTRDDERSSGGAVLVIVIGLALAIMLLLGVGVGGLWYWKRLRFVQEQQEVLAIEAEMVAARYQAEQAAAAAKPVDTPPIAVLIEIDAEGAFSIDGITLTAAELEKQLAAQVKDHPDSFEVTVRAGGDVSYLGQVLEICRDLDLNRVSVLPKKGGE